MLNQISALSHRNWNDTNPSSFPFACCSQHGPHSLRPQYQQQVFSSLKPSTSCFSLIFAFRNQTLNIFKGQMASNNLGHNLIDWFPDGELDRNLVAADLTLATVIRLSYCIPTTTTEFAPIQSETLVSPISRRLVYWLHVKLCKGTQPSSFN